MLRARSLLLLVALPTALGSCRLEVQPEQDVSLEPYVVEMLQTAAVAWNEGDLEAFLSDYLDSPSTTFLDASGFVAGFDQVREHYAPSFAPGASRDSLRFESVRVRTLSPLIGLVTARYILHQDGVTTSAGPCTLVMRWTGEDWKIIHDHSSADPSAAGD